MKKRYILIFFIILLTGIILRFYHIGAKSLWSDEAGSLITVHKDLKYLFTYLFKIDTHPPLYYLGLHLWIKIFGQTAAGLRSFSAVFSSLTIGLIFLMGKQFKDLTLGLILSFLFAISAYQIYFSQEARLYSLVMFIFCSGYYFYLRYFNYQKKTDLYLTALINLAGAYTFLYYIIILGLKDLFLLILMITGKIKKDFKHFIISRLVFIILYLPWIGIIIKKVNKLSGLSLQDNPMTGWTIPNVFIEYFAGIWKPDNLILYFLLPAVIIFSLVISLTRSRSNSP
ncbi:MAG: glycosyltransferase family 39 protein, partial [Candidatus Omnitrophica bacterium]|nr:glycosyltransferase family 39 protein [Candidatus Omnitrophota bacterium]